MKYSRKDGFKQYDSVSQATNKFLLHLKKINLGYEYVNYKKSINRVLYENIISNIDRPNSDLSAMDGYAVYAEKTFGASSNNPAILKLIGSSKINDENKIFISKSESLFLPTGAKMPRGPNAIVMLEYVKKINNSEIEIIRSVSPSENIIKKGEDFTKGNILIKSGKFIKPKDLAVFTSLNKIKIKVSIKPKISVLSTGDELIEPSNIKNTKKILNINGHVIQSMINDFGGDSIDLGICKDDESDIKNKIKLALSSSDALVISAGSSVGPKDNIPEIINSLGKPGLIVHGVSMKPSSPTGLGFINNKPIIVLPGYPVSAFIAFFVFGKILLSTLLKSTDKNIMQKAKITRSVSTIGGMTTYVRVKLIKKNGDYYAQPISASGAGILNTLIYSDGLVVVPDNKEGLTMNELVDVILFN